MLRRDIFIHKKMCILFVIPRLVIFPEVPSWVLHFNLDFFKAVKGRKTTGSNLKLKGISIYCAPIACQTSRSVLSSHSASVTSTRVPSY